MHDLFCRLECYFETCRYQKNLDAKSLLGKTIYFNRTNALFQHKNTRASSCSLKAFSLIFCIKYAHRLLVIALLIHTNMHFVDNFVDKLFSCTFCIHYNFINFH